MENINNLLEKYFRAETSIAEEQQLKNYFTSDRVLDEHLPYRALFETFSAEALQKMPVRNVKTVRKSNKVLWLRSISVSGIAASLILAFWFFSVDASADYAFVHGQKVDNQEIVHDLANKKLMQVNGLISKTMQPVGELQTVKENLKPLRDAGSKLNSIRSNSSENN